MRTADIKIGEEYAVAPQWAYDFRYPVTKMSNTKHVRVLETGIEQTRGGYFSPGTAKTGVRVEYVEDGGTGVVTSREVQQPWAEFVEWRENYLNRQAESDAHSAAWKRDCQAALEQIGYDEADNFNPKMLHDVERAFRAFVKHHTTAATEETR
jgi:hypothetical protein